ncbi:membrane protein FxsA [Crassaminicella thermophila]|uniref:Membrane protein FxsA n=1 Tax=Crassaminicella thermophila TaxID=2599308 RepID=A0A5C0SE76_CRATE|nr:FxsA family protein [Crassaminicella thermophila]QEK11594.1 membrane protein FxsA [Crassaminicella thermophila]
MLVKLILLFTIVPLVELALLFKLNAYIGLFSTLGIVIFTGVLGAYLAKSQGREILFRIRYEMREGRLPGEELINGLCVLVGGAMLLTPGILTDTLGFILVIPITREVVKVYIKKKLRKMLDEGSINFYFRW